MLRRCCCITHAVSTTEPCSLARDAEGRSSLWQVLTFNPIQTRQVLSLFTFSTLGLSRCGPKVALSCQTQSPIPMAFTTRTLKTSFATQVTHITAPALLPYMSSSKTIRCQRQIHHAWKVRALGQPLSQGSTSSRKVEIAA